MTHPASYIIPTLLILLALFAPFFFPWPFTLALGVLASFFFPPTVILTGVFLDILYFNNSGFPYFTLISIVLAIVTFFVQQFVKTRIMS